MPDLITIEDMQAGAYTSLNKNVELRKVQPGINDMHLRLEKVLGRTGYALVMANAPAFTAQAPDTALYITLLNDYIKPYLCWGTLMQSYWDLHSEADRGGVFTKSGEDYQAASGQIMANKVKIAEGRYTAYLERLLQFLNDNSTIFTWASTSVTGEERITDTNSSRNGISFRRSCRQTSYRG